MNRCFYCDGDIAGDWDREFDHFPVPRAAGGKDGVLACRRCHFLKDRAPSRSVSTGAIAELDIAPGHVVFLQKTFLDAFEDGCPEVARRTLRRIWGALPTPLRIADARMLAHLYLTEGSFG